MVGNKVELEAKLDHPSANAESPDQWISRGDGRIIGLDRDGLHLLAPSNISSTYRVPNRDLLHLAAATRDRAWYTYADLAGNCELWNAHTLVLAPVAKPMS